MKWSRKYLKSVFAFSVFAPVSWGTVFFVRLGDAMVYEEEEQDIQNIQDTPNVQVYNTKKVSEEISDTEALTQKGRQQVLETGLWLAYWLKHNDAMALVWTSTRRRARQSADILVDTLRTYGALVYRHMGSCEKDCTFLCRLLNSPDLTEEFWQQKGKDRSFVSLWRELSDNGLLPMSSTLYSEHEYRLKQTLRHAVNVTRIHSGSFECPRIAQIMVCHYETVTPILQSAYGGDVWVVKGRGLGKAGVLRIDILPQEEHNLQAVLRVDMTYGPNPNVEDPIAYLLFDNAGNFIPVEQ